MICGTAQHRDGPVRIELPNLLPPDTLQFFTGALPGFNPSLPGGDLFGSPVGESRASMRHILTLISL